MAPRAAKPWKVVRQELPIDEARVAAYAQIIEAQHRIAASRTRAGMTDVEIDAALDASEPDDPESLSPRELYLTVVERFVAGLGGRLDGASADFGGEGVELPSPEDLDP
jgi:hypothetical protein